ncbi:MAG: hypothetical protein B7X11_03210 [Acidobacteria bacterium 37-65-4]|nr:MAG: hypothetical protein B7X11_03210 [Acidobacteria bacterium 37-65-4]
MPAVASDIALEIVSSGWLIVPGFESLPVGETYMIVCAIDGADIRKNTEKIRMSLDIAYLLHYKC